MKVLKNNINNPTYIENKNEIEVNCFECDSVLSITKDDLSIGVYGAYGFVCPCCGKWSIIDDEIASTFGCKLQTIDDIQFPLHFRTFDTDNNVVKKIDDEKINKYIRECVDKLRKEKDTDNTINYIQTGDTFVMVQKFDRDETYWVLIAKNPYETEMKFSQKDYRLDL